MRWQDLDQENCSLARALAVVGDRWTLLVLREAFLRVRRFDDFQSRLGIARRVLAERLVTQENEAMAEELVPILHVEDAHAAPPSKVRLHQEARTTVSELTGIMMAAMSGLMTPVTASAAPTTL